MKGLLYPERVNFRHANLVEERIEEKGAVRPIIQELCSRHPFQLDLQKRPKDRLVKPADYRSTFEECSEGFRQSILIQQALVKPLDTGFFIQEQLPRSQALGAALA